MREYGHSYLNVLELPLRTFWMLNRQIDRLRAEGELRLLAVFNSAQHAETAQKVSEALRMELGTPVIVEKKFDEKKFQELKQKFGQGL